MTTNGTTALATAPSAPLARAEASAPAPFFTPDDIALIKRTVARDATDAEFEHFVKVAALRRLNPLTNQINLQIYNKDRPDKRSAISITTIHGLRLIAARTGRYMPGRETTFVTDDKGCLVSATAYVKVYHRESGTWHEVSETAYWAEFDKGERLWKTMPRLMLGKCAEALVLRRAFPEDTAGLYTDDEMGAPPIGTADGDIIEGHVTETRDTPASQPSAPAAKASQVKPTARMTPDEVKAAWAEQDDRAQVLGLADWQHTIPSGQKLAWYIDEVSRRDTLLQQAESEMIDDEKMPF